MTIERVERGDACKALRTKLGAQQRVAALPVSIVTANWSSASSM